MDRVPGSLIDINYYEINGRAKKYGIYCQVLDRWLLVDWFDPWITFKTAQILSSKIATTVFILPPDINGMTNSNCLNYTILDKTKITLASVSMLIRSQIPVMKTRLLTENIVEAGLPKDYNNPLEIDHIVKLKEYTDFVNRCVFAIEWSNAAIGFYDNKTFSQSFFPDEWLYQINTYQDRTKDPDGFFNQLRKILYHSNTIEEAKDQIKKMFEDNGEMHWVKERFFTIIEMELQ